MEQELERYGTPIFDAARTSLNEALSDGEVSDFVVVFEGENKEEYGIEELSLSKVEETHELLEDIKQIRSLIDEGYDDGQF